MFPARALCALNNNISFRFGNAPRHAARRHERLPSYGRRALRHWTARICADTFCCRYLAERCGVILLSSSLPRVPRRDRKLLRFSACFHAWSGRRTHLVPADGYVFNIFVFLLGTFYARRECVHHVAFFSEGQSGCVLAATWTAGSGAPAPVTGDRCHYLEYLPAAQQYQQRLAPYAARAWMFRWFTRLFSLSDIDEGFAALRCSASYHSFACSPALAGCLHSRHKHLCAHAAHLCRRRRGDL
jgi:hypothetical protein